MPSDITKHNTEIETQKQDSKLTSAGKEAIQGLTLESQVIETPTIHLETNKISREDVKKSLGRDSLWITDEGEPIEPKGSHGRGVDYEKIKNANIGGTFEAIDDFDAKTGTATSFKSIDLYSSTYKDNPSKSKSTINDYIDDLAGFPGSVSTQKGKRVEIMPEDIKVNNLSLAIPEGSLTENNFLMLSECKKYGKSRNVNLSIDEVS
jgi:hypothetical protein